MEYKIKKKNKRIVKQARCGTSQTIQICHRGGSNAIVSDPQNNKNNKTIIEKKQTNKRDKKIVRIEESSQKGAVYFDSGPRLRKIEEIYESIKQDIRKGGTIDEDNDSDSSNSIGEDDKFTRKEQAKVICSILGAFVGSSNSASNSSKLFNNMRNGPSTALFNNNNNNSTQQQSFDKNCRNTMSTIQIPEKPIKRPNMHSRQRKPTNLSPSKTHEEISLNKSDFKPVAMQSISSNSKIAGASLINLPYLIKSSVPFIKSAAIQKAINKSIQLYPSCDHKPIYHVEHKASQLPTKNSLLFQTGIGQSKESPYFNQQKNKKEKRAEYGQDSYTNVSFRDPWSMNEGILNPRTRWKSQGGFKCFEDLNRKKITKKMYYPFDIFRLLKKDNQKRRLKIEKNSLL